MPKPPPVEICEYCQLAHQSVHEWTHLQVIGLAFGSIALIISLALLIVWLETKYLHNGEWID